jgi:hypothetical protein
MRRRSKPRDEPAPAENKTLTPVSPSLFVSLCHSHVLCLSVCLSLSAVDRMNELIQEEEREDGKASHAPPSPQRTTATPVAAGRSKSCGRPVKASSLQTDSHRGGGGQKKIKEMTYRERVCSTPLPPSLPLLPSLSYPLCLSAALVTSSRISRWCVILIS